MRYQEFVVYKFINNIMLKMSSFQICNTIRIISLYYLFVIIIIFIMLSLYFFLFFEKINFYVISKKGLKFEKLLAPKISNSKNSWSYNHPPVRTGGANYNTSQVALYNTSLEKSLKSAPKTLYNTQHPKSRWVL